MKRLAWVALAVLAAWLGLRTLRGSGERTDRPVEPSAPAATSQGTALVPPVEASAMDATRAIAARVEADATAPAASAPGEPSFQPLDLYGRVVDLESEEPLPGARVVVARHPSADGTREVLGVLTTDDDGRFRLEELGRRVPASLFVEAEGYTPHARRVTTGQHATIRLQRARPPCALRLFWREGRRPIAGAVVSVPEQELAWNGEGLVPREWTSDGEGRVSLSGIAPRQGVSLRVRLPDSLSVVRRVEADELGREVELLFDREGTLLLRLVTLDGGVPLTHRSGSIDGFGTFTSDGAGLVPVDMVAGAFEHGWAGQRVLRITVEGFCRSGILLDESLLDGAPRDVPLTPGWSVHGVVRDDEGFPVAGAHVFQTNPLCRNLQGPEDAFPGLPPGITIDGFRSFRWVESAEDGSYALDHAFTACADVVAIRASKEGYRQGSAEVPVPVAGETLTADVVLEPWRASLVGRVLRDGEPLACSVRAMQEGGRSTSDCDTDDEGAYEIRSLQPGLVRLEVLTLPDPETFAPTVSTLHEEELQLAAGETRHDLSLRDDAHPLAGIVRTTEGEPVPGALVFVREKELRSFTNGLWGVSGEQTRTDAAGRFRLTTLDPGDSVELVAASEDLQTSRRVRPGDEQVELVLPASARLLLDVRTPPPAGEPVRQLFLVEGWPAGEPHGFPTFVSLSSVAEDGRHGFELALGSWDLELLVRDFAPTTLSSVEVRPGAPPLRVVLDEGVSVDVRYEDPPEALGRLAPYYWDEAANQRGQAGDPYPGIVGGQLGWRLPVEPQGGTLQHLAPGTYVLASVGGWRIEPDRFTVEPGAAPTITFRWIRDEAR